MYSAVLVLTFSFDTANGWLVALFQAAIRSLRITVLRMAACQDRESTSVNDLLGELLIFRSKTPFNKLFSKIMFLSFSDS